MVSVEYTVSMANFIRDEIKSTQKYCAIIVGAGFFGLTVAERIAEIIRRPVLIIDRRDHIGGNAWSKIDENSGIEIHSYGPHIFHTSNEKVWEYVNRFTAFNEYRHHVWSSVQGQLFSLPISLVTMSQFWGRQLSPQEARYLVNKSIVPNSRPNNFEEKALATIGQELYETFFKEYTLKQWQTDPRRLPASVFGRLPVRYTMNTRYFDDKYEGIPVEGYFTWINRMVKSELIDIKLTTNWHDISHLIPSAMPVMYTGAIDEFFNYKHGALGWRTLEFEFESINKQDFQGTSQMNYPDFSIPFTRIVEYKHFHPENHLKPNDTTIVSREYPRFASQLDEAFYPINSNIDINILKKYRQENKNCPNVLFGGRLGTYKYLDMHMAISSALVTFYNELKYNIEIWVA